MSPVPVEAVIAYTLIETAKLNSVGPQAWLTDEKGLRRGLTDQVALEASTIAFP